LCGDILRSGSKASMWARKFKTTKESELYGATSPLDFCSLELMMTTDDWFNQCKQLANDLKSSAPIPAIEAAKRFDFPGVYIFSEESGRIIYIGESQDIPHRLERHFGSLRRDETEIPVASQVRHRTEQWTLKAISGSD
jgi:GIY-YIG catalytic domain